MPTVAVKLVGDCDFKNLPLWVGRFKAAIEAVDEGAPFELEVDLAGLTFLSSSSLAALGALLAHSQSSAWFRGGAIHPPQNRAAHSWLARMDFYDLLKAGVDYPWTRWSSMGRFRELVQVATERDADRVVQELGTILSEQTGLERAIVSSFQTVVAELIDNVFHHANSPVGAFVCAQTYPQRRVVEIGIADCGQGIAASLRRNPALADRFHTAVEAVTLAVQPGVTGRPERNSGIGLSWTSKLIEKNEGALMIYSDDAVFRVSRHGSSVIEVSSSWPGTLVAVRFSMDRAVTMKDVMDEVDRNRPIGDALFE